MVVRLFALLLVVGALSCAAPDFVGPDAMGGIGQRVTVTPDGRNQRRGDGGEMVGHGVAGQHQHGPATPFGDFGPPHLPPCYHGR